ncbi:MAG: hypothetical protein ACRD2R_02255, partial [Terriglobales bacterium]
MQGVTFALYADERGGAPLWLETQNVTADEAGRYSVLLGSQREDGLPQEVFTANAARWLGVRANQPGVEEQARVLLVSVPYALKAADAETLGGQPLSAFVLTDARRDSDGAVAAAATTDGLPTAALTTPGQLAKLVDTVGGVGDSIVTETSGGNIGVGIDTPVARLTVADTQTNRSAMAIKHQRNTVDGDWVGFDFLGTDNVPLGRLRHIRNEVGQRFDFVFEAVPFGGVMTEVARFTGKGRLGIGTTDPSEPLTVQDTQTNSGALGVKHQRNTVEGDWVGLDFLGTDNATVGRLRNIRNAANSRFDISVETVAFGGVPIEVARFTGNGNLGVGTAAPAQKLDVTGNARASGDVIGGTRLCIVADCRTSWPAGTVTSITAGTGLSATPANPIIASGTLSIDTAIVPRLGVANSFTMGQSAPSFTASTASGTPVSGTQTATSGIGVHGLATSGTGATYGVYGQSDSTGGR